MSLSQLPSARYRITAPGRVNLLGEHVDYNEGIVLPAAIDRVVTVAANPREDDLVRLNARDMNSITAFRLADLDAKIDADGRPLPGWAMYPAGVAWALRDHGLNLRGVDAVFSSTVPIGSGLSSSAAVEVAFATLWRALAGSSMDAMTLALLCQRAENLYVGVNSGLMDQFASAHGVEGHALYFDTRNLEWRPVPLPADTAIVIADSKMRRSLSSSAYNERRATCEEAVRLLQHDLPAIHSLRDVSPNQFEDLAHTLPEIVRMRAQHVIAEIARVERAVILLESGDAAGFGALMYAGHASLRDLYEVSIPELDTLVEIASRLPGCLGARLTGAGFGGCTVNLVEQAHAEDFTARLKKQYFKTTGKHGEVYICRASHGPTLKEI